MNAGLGANAMSGGLAGGRGGMDLLAGLDGSGDGTGGTEPRPAADGGAAAAARLSALPSCSSNPLVRAALRLLNLMATLRATVSIDDPERLRRSLVGEVRFFEELALQANVARDEIVGARYCLCTALDECAAQTPWGSQGVWSRHSLLVTFHNETWGGEKYYQLLGRLAQYPERHQNLIELLYYCNALGFEGKFRIVDNGHAQLEILKRRIATLINTTRNGYEHRLSPHWEGEATVRDAWRMIPPWVIATLCALIAFICYVWFSFALGPESDAVFSRLAALEPPPTAVAVSTPKPAPPRLLHLFDGEVAQGLLEVRDLADRSTITLMGDGIFDSGRAEVRPRFLPVLERVGHSLNGMDGTVLVTGYTDSVPMRSARFPSNWHLSEARAQSVAAILSTRLTQPERLKVRGRGEAEPVASNATPEGRARNRRVEITVLVFGDGGGRSDAPAAAEQGGGRQ